MDAISDYVKIVTTLLGIAYPILFQVVARLDEKYSSNLIVELFDKERVKQLFKILLITSLISFFLWTLKLPSFIHVKSLDYFINNSAAILIIINTSLLVITFFFFVNKILVYYTPSKFVNYLIKNHDRNDINLTHFKALTDVFLHSIKKQNPGNSKTISRFFYDAFKIERDKSKNEAVVYPDCYYVLVYNSIEELALLKDKRNAGLEVRTAGGVWLLGELQDSEISQTTYTWLWNNILLAVRYEKDDMIIYHWEHCHQFVWTNFKNIYPEYNDEHEVINQANLDKIQKQKDIFLEFHYALGALLMFKKRYTCLNKIFHYSTSEPPKYELLPDTMGEIFDRFNHFRDPFDYNYPWMSSKFPFPDQAGISSSNIIKTWFCTYMSVLFLRQYTILPHLVFMRPLDLPSSPNTQGEKRKWIEGLDLFKNLVESCLSNVDLIKSLNFEFITKEWCLKHNKIYPIDFIDRLKEKLEGEYSDGEMNLPISPDKVEKFYNSTAEILDRELNCYSEINKKEKIDRDYNKWFINGNKMLQSKDAYFENPEVYYFEFDSILAALVAENIRIGIYSTFNLSYSKRFLLKPENIFKAIDKLNFDHNFLIINFGANIERYISFYKVGELTTKAYKGIQIITLPATRLYNQTIFVINKADLPNIISLDIQPEIIKKYSLRKISANHNFYASVIDLNDTTEEIREENLQDQTTEQLRKSVLLTIIQSIEVRWKKNVDLIELIEFSEYKQMGSPNELDDIH